MGKFCLTNIIVIPNEVTGLVDGGLRVDVYLAYSKFFDTDFHRILIDKLMEYVLDEWGGAISNWP